MCLRVLPACMYVCTMCMPWSSEDGVRSPRTGIGIVVESPRESRHGTPVFCKSNELSTEPSLQPGELGFQGLPCLLWRTSP